MSAGQVVGLVTALVIAAVVVAAVVAVGIRRRRAARDQEAHDELDRLGTTAGSSLVRADERARLAEDELAFAVAEVGEDETTQLSPLVRRARERLGEAFRLHQLLHDHIPDTPAQQREWLGRIVELCASADGFLDELDSGLAAKRATVRSTPQLLDRVDADAQVVRDRIADAHADVARLRAAYADSALRPVADNPEQAERLLEFAGRSTAAARRRLETQRVGEAAAAARAAEESVRRAQGLLDAVGDFESEALRAESALGAMVAESRTELAQARALPADQRAGRVETAIAALDDSLAALPAPGAPADPVASLSRVREANTALDDAVRDRVESAERARRMAAQLAPALDDAERQVATARSVVDDYRAPVGPDARTRLAEAERELAAARTAQDPERGVDGARRAAALASEAATLAHRDIARGGNGQRWDGGWNGPGGGYGRGGYGGGYGVPGQRRGGSDAFGAVLGGMVLGGILDDLGDMFD